MNTFLVRHTRRPALRAHLTRVALAVGLCALCARSAAAQGDAGTQSVFAYGAGNRASAMGGAFVAAADDASAMIWNPAGLGLVSRLELQGVQSAALGPGMSESYAAFAMPSWRWGTAGVSFRSFGVDGIEQRDARNVLLASDLKDQQMELALGYGRSWGDAWSLGGAVKMQRQSLAGFSGSGLGVDVGVNVRPAAAFGIHAAWAEGLSWGLGLRNVVAPAVRLDVESVPDPASLSTGIAWRTLTRSGSGLLTEVDVSRANSVSPRLHAGLEYRAFPGAALRVGLNDGVITAGTGLKLHGVTLDYAFEDNPLSPSHRAGVTLQFGQTTSESRIAYRRNEDAKVESKLAEAFRQRQVEQVAELIKRATDARAHGDLDGALEALALVGTLEPGRDDAGRLELSCIADKARGLEKADDFAGASLLWERAVAVAPADTEAVAAAARCRTKSDALALRTTELRAVFARAMDAFAGEDFVAARDGFQRLLAMQPGDTEAARMLSRTEQALQRRADRLAGQAMAAIRTGSLDAAQAWIGEAQAIDRRAPAVVQAAMALARAREVAASQNASRVAPHTATVAPAAATGPRLGDREIEDLYQRGLASLRAARADDALRYWELVWSSRPGYREVAGYLKREYLTRGMEAFAAGRLDDAMAHWEHVLRVDPADERARGYLARAQGQRTRSREILGGGP